MVRTAVDLFSGIGGFSLAAEANGIEVVCHVEIDKDCQEYLRRRWPEVPVYRDIKTFPSERYAGADLVMGGPPCQPISRAGKRKGAEDDRWLWDETLKVVEIVRPRWCLFENPPGIRNLGLDGILSHLEGLGYTVGTVDIPACAVNAPHIRQRYWIVAHNGSKGREGSERGRALQEQRAPAHGSARQHVQGHWNSYQWTPCADGKVRRTPDAALLLADGAAVDVVDALAEEGWPKRSVLKALGNSIVGMVAAKVIAAMVEVEARWS